MIIPVRCFSCGTVVASAWEAYLARTKAGEEPEAVLDTIGLERYCCRRMIIANIDLMKEVLPF